ncbi:uncharacterized protein LOC144033528 [Festucalex cinctus]
MDAVGERLWLELPACQRKWKVIRDKFVRIKKRLGGRSGDAGGNKVPDLYFFLSWLSPHIRHRESESNFDDEKHTSTHAKGPEDPSEGGATPRLATPRLATPRPLPGSSDLLYDLQPHYNSSQASCHLQNSHDRSSPHHDRSSPQYTSHDRSSPQYTSHDRSSPQYTSHDRSSPQYTSHDRSSPQHIGTQLTSPRPNEPHLTSPCSSSPWPNSSQSSNASSSSPQPSTSTGNTDHQLHPLQSPPHTTTLKRKRRDDLLKDLEARRKVMEERLLAIMDESHRFGSHVGDLVRRLHEKQRGMAMREVASYLYSLME